MNASILTGSGALVTLVPDMELGIDIKSVEFVIPNSDTTSNPSVTLTGTNDTYTFNNTVYPEIKFMKNETVAITSSGLTSSISAIVKWINYGDQAAYIDMSQSRIQSTISMPKWTKR